MGKFMSIADPDDHIARNAEIPGGFLGTFRISAKTSDHVLLTIWLIVTFRQFPKDELILYPLAAYFAISFFRDFERHFPVIRHSLILFAFPVWCALSLLWGLKTDEIVKNTAQLFLTVFICYCAALRLERRQILVSLLIAGGIYGLASLLMEPTGGKATRGVFSSKNTLGLSMVLLWSAALCIALDRGAGRALRLVALGLATVAIVLVFRAQSATAVLLAGGTAMLILFGRLTLGRGLFHPGVLMVLLAAGATGLIGTGLVLALHDVDPAAFILEKFGKDATLTGRTVLWGYAIEQIRENPLLGVGAKGFWLPQDWTSPARRIYIDFHKEFDAIFTFHNSYLEIAVHQGLIGAAIGVMAFLWAVWQVFSAAMQTSTMPRMFFVVIAAVLMARNMTEPGLMSAFSMMTMILYIGALISVREKIAAGMREAHG